VVAIALMIGYEICWVRYFRSDKTMADMYEPFLTISLPLAFLPPAAFFLLGIYGSCFPLILSSFIFGIGHIGIHKEQAWNFTSSYDPPKIVSVLKGIGKVLGGFILVVIVGVIAVRNFNFLDHLGNFSKGIDQSEYLKIGGQEQYVLTMGKDKSNPVIIYLHGGPSSPDSYVTYWFADHLMDKYTFVCWDQRGCGRTYFRNEALPNYEGVDTALSDLDELVDIVRSRFGKQKVIIMGFSYGSLLGTKYVQLHPEKVSAYVGIGQCINNDGKYEYDDAVAQAKALGDSTDELDKAYKAFTEHRDVETEMALRNAETKYHTPAIADNSAIWAVFSPYFGCDDMRWLIIQMTYDTQKYVALNRKLMDAVVKFDIYEQPKTYEMPVFFISGGDDWVSPAGLAEEYAEKIKAPDSAYISIEGCGHGVQYTKPKEFADDLIELLKTVK
ncbi:MAG: alpha/beta hydrolase, partial [Oscillospiraceae bacterium]|nr:alpha/beta hydrolase [Oscillospiraceae bacterium]